MLAVGTPVPEPDVYDGKGAAPLPVFFDGTALLIFFRSESDRGRQLLRSIEDLRRWAAPVPVIGVSQETIEDTAELFQELGVSLPVVIDDRPYSASDAFEISRVPALALIRDDVVAYASDELTPGELDSLGTALSAGAGLSLPGLDAPSAPSKSAG